MPSQSPIASLLASKRRRRDRAAGDVSVRSGPKPAGPLFHLERTGRTVLTGHAFDPSAPERRFVVELVLNGIETEVRRADLFDPALLVRFGGDGCHGFRFDLDPDLVPSLRTGAVRLANSAEPVGSEVTFQGAFDPAQTVPVGHVAWIGGLRLTGWATSADPASTPLIEAFLDDERIAFARADQWRSVDGKALPGFELTLPPFLADGCAHRVEVRCDGQELPGSPVPLIAFEDGLESHLAARSDVDAQAVRGALFDAWFPNAVPFDRFDAVEARFVPTPNTAPSVALAVIGEERAAKATLAALRSGPVQHIGCVLAAKSGPTRFEPGDLLRFLREDAADCAAVLFLPAGAKLRPGGLERLGAALEAERRVEIAYGDLLIEAEDGTLFPLAFPAFDRERSLEQAGPALAFAMRKTAAIEAARRGTDDLFRLFLAPLGETGAHRATHLHVPGFGLVLPKPDTEALTPALQSATYSHLKARGIEADLNPRQGGTLPAIRVRRKAPTRSVTLIIDVDDHDDIDASLASLEETRRRYSSDVLLVTRDLPENRREALQVDGIAHLSAAPFEGPAVRFGRAADTAETDLVCFLDTSLAPAGSGWLEELIGRMDEADVGAAVPLILDRSGLVEQAGLMLQPSGRPAPAFADRAAGDPGYGDALLVARQVAAAGGAGLLTRRADFLALGGFDPQLFSRFHGATDYCLRLGALGRRVIASPDARLIRVNGGTEPELPALRLAREREERVIFARWAEVFASDPSYSPLLDRSAVPYSGLAWPPGPLQARHFLIRPARAVPLGW